MKKIILSFLLCYCMVQSQTQNVTIDLISQFRGHGGIRTFDVVDNKLFVVSGDDLEVFDISEIDRSTKIGEYHYVMDNNSKTTQIKVKDNFLFSSNGYKGLYVIDVSDMNNIRPRRSFFPSITNSSQGFNLYENLIFMYQIIGYGNSNVLLADISDPLNIVEKGYFRIPFYSENYTFKVKGDYLYIIAEKYYEYNYQGADMLIVDISDPQHPTESYREHSGFNSLALQDNYLFTNDTTNTLKIFDVSDSHNPIIVNELPFDNISFSLDNYRFVTRRLFHNGDNLKYNFHLYNTSSINNFELKDSIIIETEVNKGFKSHSVVNDRLFLQKELDLTIYDISFEKFNYERKIIFPQFFYALDVLIDGDFGYVSTTESLLIFNISDLINPILVSSYAHFGTKTKIYKYNDLIYLGNRIIDVSDKYNPKLSAYLPQDGRIRDVFVKNNLCYSLDNSFRIINVEDKNNPLYIDGSYFPIENGEYISVDSNFVYIVTNTQSSPYTYSSELQIYHLNGNSIKQIGTTLLNNDPTCLVISGDYAYEGFVSELPGIYEHGVNIYDISDKSNPKYVSGYLTSDIVRGMEFNNDLLWLAQNYDGIKLLDVSNKFEPKIIAEYNTSGRSFGVDVRDNNIFIADYDGGMKVLKSHFSDDNNGGQTPKDFTLLQNYPNPFNSGTTIKYYLPTDSKVEVSIYNSLGAKIRVLEKKLKAQGWYSLNYSPTRIASGVYFLSVKTNNKNIVKKIVYLK